VCSEKSWMLGLGLQMLGTYLECGPLQRWGPPHHKPQEKNMEPRYVHDEVWPHYARERLLFLCKPMECLGADIALSIVAVAIMIALSTVVQ
jgi:hypothetical protein